MWEQHDSIFSVLTMQDQWDIHRYFQLTKALTDDKLRIHRKSVCKTDASLPARTAKNVKFMERLDQLATAKAKGNEIVYNKIIGRFNPNPGSPIRSVARPEPDYEKLAKAFIALAEARNEIEGVR